MKTNNFDELMKKFYVGLKETFSPSNVLNVHSKGISPTNRSRLFLIKTTVVRKSMITDTALIIRVCLKNESAGNEIYGVTSYYGYPYLSKEKEDTIITKSGELLESIVPSGFVICESGDVKVKIIKMASLSELFGRNAPSHVV